eukprot:gene2499-3205_t
MFVFDLNKKNIFKNFMYYDSENEIPLDRHSHTSIVYEKKVVIFGGKLFFEKKQIDELYEFNFESHLWKLIKPSGNIPTPRSHHTCIRYSNFILVFGGKNENKIFNDLYKFNFDEEIWSSIQLESLPFLYEHTCNLNLTTMFIFGGKDKSNLPTNNLYEYDILNYSWKELKQKNKPSSRSGHSMSLFNNEQLILFGGSSVNCLLNDLHFLNLESFTWKCIKGIGDIPSKRKGHSSVIFEDSMFISSGFDSYRPYCNDLFEYNIIMNSWKRIIKFDQVLTKRFNHSSSLVNGVLCVFGGCGKDAPNYYENYKNENTENKTSIFNEFENSEDNFDNYNKSFMLKDEEEGMKNFDFNSFQDFEILIEKKSYILHKCILSQSKHFEIRFNENEKLDFLDLTNKIPKKYFEVFINLLYGKSIFLENLIDLIEIFKYSFMFKINNFSDFCLNQLYIRINSTNVIEILIKSENLKLELIKEFCFQIIQNSQENDGLLILLQDKNSKLFFELKDRIIGLPYIEPYNDNYFLNDKLSQHLRFLFQTKKYFDITLICSNQKKIKAHKIIIGQLEYFKVMLLSSFKESSQFEIDFDFSDQVLIIILHYLYLRELKFPQNNIYILIELLKCSEFFMISEIMERTEKIILNQINSSNSMEIIQYCIANQISGSIPEKCWKFIKSFETFELVKDLFENQIHLKKIIFQQNEEIQNLQLKLNESDDKIEKLNEKYDDIIEKLNKL